MPSASMESSILSLRKRLSSREGSLASLRAKVKSAKNVASNPAKSSISDIQRRYLSAVADLETKGKESSEPLLENRSDAVSSLASKWDKGMEGKKVERTSVTVRGDVRNAQKSFASKDTPKMKEQEKKATKQKSSEAIGPAEILEEDGDEIPEWAKNQRKLVIKKENARTSVRDVDVRELQGSIKEQSSKDGSEMERETVSTSGNVKAALAMWGKTAEEDALLIAKKKEDEMKRAAAAERMKLQKEDEDKRKAQLLAIEKFKHFSLNDLSDEPTNEIELIAFLERKIALVDKEIEKTEDELSNYE